MTDAVSAFVLPNLVFTAGILAVLALRKPVRTQFGARMAYALWLLPLLVLAASFLPPRVIEIAQSAPVFETLPSGPEYVLPAAPAEASPAAPVFTVAAKPAFDPLLAALTLWIAGALAMFSWLGRRQALFMIDVREGKAGPAVVGVFRPRIITPSDFDARFDAHEQRVILTHETIHLARQDARINALVACLRCICWYNPLVHIGAHAMRIDQELACDAAVVERHPKARRLYADALLKAQLAARPLPLGCYWPAGTEHPLMERIEMLKQSAPGQLRRLAGATLLITLAATAATAAWAAMPPTTRVVYENPQQTPAPASAQKLDFSPRNEVRFTGKVVAVNLTGSPPTVQVQGTPLKFFDDQPEPTDQVWTVDLTSKGRAPTQERDLTAATIGATVDVYAYRMDKACTSNCVIWARNFKATRPQGAQASRVRFPGVPDRFSDNIGHMVRVKGKISSIVRSGSDNIITVHATSVVRGPAPPTANNGETGDWRLFQFDGANLNRNPFNSQAAVGMDVEAAGMPEKNDDCRTPCTLAIFSYNLGLDANGQPAGRGPNLGGRPYNAATMGPPANRPNDAPSPIAQPGFNDEDYVVVRGTVVRIEGGNPVKTFWVRAREINRNFEKTQANTDIWRVDRQIPPGGAPPAQITTGMSVRVDGYVSTSCQPECRIQPMLIDLAQQQAAAQPQSAPAQPAPVQPIRFDRQAAPTNPQQASPQQTSPQQTSPKFVPADDWIPFAKYFDADRPMILKGKVADKGLFEGKARMLVIENAATRSGSQKEFTPDGRRWRVVLGATSSTPELLVDALIGREVTVRGYNAKDTSCGQGCLMNGRDITLTPLSIPPPAAQPTSAPIIPSMTGPRLQHADEPQKTADLAPEPSSKQLPDLIPFDRYFDVKSPVLLKGRVTKVDSFEGHAALMIEEIETTTPGYVRVPHSDVKVVWRVVLDRLENTPAWGPAAKLVGQTISVRGYSAKGEKCKLECMMAGRDIYVGNETLPGWLVPRPPPPKPRPIPPPI